MTAVPTCRFGDRCSLVTLADALECLGSHSDKTRVEIAAGAATLHPERSPAYLRTCLSPNDDTHQVQLAVAPALFHASGNPALLLWHARQCGFGVHRVPKTGDTRRDGLLAMLDVVDAVGTAAHELRHAQADGRVTPGEAQAFTLRAQQAISELVEAIAAVNFDVMPPSR